MVTVSTTKKPITSEDLQRAVTKGDVETVRNILPGECCNVSCHALAAMSWYTVPAFVINQLYVH